MILKKNMEALQTQHVELLSRIKKLEDTREKNQDQKAHDLFSKFLTPGQIKFVLKGNRRIRWCNEDIASAIALRSVSPKCYRYLKTKLHYPLPSLTTLRKWTNSINLTDGVLDDVLLLLEHKAKSMSAIEKITVLSIDEMHLSQRVGFDQKREEVVGPHKAVQVIGIRGLLSKWQQIIYYAYDQVITVDILKDVICKLGKSGYDVVSIVNDTVPGNIALWKQLGITVEKTYIKNFYNPSKNIYVFADVHHLIKAMRNYFIDHGFIINEVVVDKKPIEELLSHPEQFDTAHKITQHDLNVKENQRENVKTATNLFSNAVSKALEYAGNKGYIGSHWKETKHFIKIVNDWFDVFNTGSKYRKHEAYGIRLDEQNELLNSFETIVRNMRGVGKCSLLPFQKGIIISIKSLQQLQQQLEKEHGISYILTYRLNRDVIENFFSLIRGSGAPNDPPSAYEFMFRLKWYILGRPLSATNKNTDIQSSSNENAIQDEECVTHLLFRSIPLLDDPNEHDVHLQNPEQDEVISRELDSDAIEYIAGYIAHCFKDKYPNLGQSANTLPLVSSGWICHLSEEQLIKPQQEFLNVIKLGEKLFRGVHDDGISKQSMLISLLTDKLMSKISSGATPDVSYEVIRRFFITRTFTRIRFLNQNLKQPEDKRVHKKIKKLVTV